MGHGGKREGAGAKKGVPKKRTEDLRNALMRPFDQEWFDNWAKENPDLYFTKVVTKLLPKEIIGDLNLTAANFRIVLNAEGE